MRRISNVDFDPKRLFLADLNGTGCADLVYVDFDRVHFWFNQSGNRWSEQQTISGTPTVSDVDSIQFADVFGTGTATLLWSYDYAAQPEGNYKALDFCGGVKPYVLTEMSNNMGATTRVSYAPSTQYFLEDQANGTPVGHQAAVPGAGRRQSRGDRSHQQDEAGHHVQISSRLF